MLGDGGAAASGRRRRWRLVAAEQQDWIRISRMAQIITRLRGVLGGRTNQRGSGRLGRVVRALQAGGGRLVLGSDGSGAAGVFRGGRGGEGRGSR